MNTVYVVYEDWRDREYPPEILGVYADKRDAAIGRKGEKKSLQKKALTMKLLLYGSMSQ